MNRVTEPAANELELQRRWAESHWPTPFLQSPQGSPIRVISPGLWNRGPGPDFRGAQILDAEGRSRRGDVELHLQARSWLQHGHDTDPAYGNLLLHVVEWVDRTEPRSRASTSADPRIPPPVPLPQATSNLPQAMSNLPAAMNNAASETSDPPQTFAAAANAPPCAGIAKRAGAAAVEARLLRIGQHRFLRKMAELRGLHIAPGPGSDDDRRSVVAAARALGQPNNAMISEHAARQALGHAEQWQDFRPLVDGDGWRRGRGALGSPSGLGQILVTLVERWTTGDAAPWAAFQRLSALPLREAIGELRIAKRLGPARAAQLLADAVYPLTGSWTQWSRIAGARYRRTNELRERIECGAVDQLAWRHPQTQALLELERTRCRQLACRICPLAALDLRLRSGREDFRP